jgi:rfaE bifunctional protein nucleotidyltransferase chain/domain
MGRVVRAGRHLREQWEARAVAITLGADGAVLVTGAEPPLVVPAQPVAGDACGAGDCLAATASVALAAGALPSEALRDAVATAGDFVAGGGAAAMATPATPLTEAIPRTPALHPRLSPVPAAEAVRPGSLGLALARIGDVRARGGTVVATGGCFDLLHPGHIGVLQAARALGDYLVVCLNSDASVRRLKGPGRPVQREADRAAVLSALSCVDHVVTFDEDTPVELLRRLRPDIFAKGGDYALDLLPEEEALHAWGGQLVILPYLAGRSTTALLDQAGRRGEA